MDKLDMQSKNLVDENISKIAELFPNCITEGKNEEGQVVKLVDFDLLKQELSKDIVEGNDERYTLNWAGKKQAILTANSPINATLRPCREESVDFDNTKNLYIEGDNLDVLKLLRETYLGKVKMIYIDPPYNTGNDFVYEDDFATSTEDYLQASKSYDEQGNRMFQNSDSNGRFHSDWLSMMYTRLKIAKDLLSDDGVIFLSINDAEQNNLLKLCFEIFGEKNFVANLVWANNEGGGSSDSKFFKVKHEYILCFAKNAEVVPGIVNVDIEDIDRYKLSDEFESVRGKFQLVKLASASLQYSESLDYAITCPDGTEIYPKDNTDKDKAIWRWSKQKLSWGIENGFVVMKKDRDSNWQIYTKQYVNCDKDGNIIPRTKKPLGFIDKFSSTQGSNELFKLLETKTFSYPKPTELIKYILNRFSFNSNELVLDFFSGSATTAHAVMQLNAEDGGNRKFIMVQLPEICDEKSEAYKAGYKNICEIGKERIRRAGKKIKEENKDCNIDAGFRVLKLDSSNMKDIYYRPAELNQASLLDYVSNIKEDRTPEDLLFQVMLDMGVMLSSEIKTIDIKGKKVFNVNDGNLVCCFDDELTDEVVTEIAKLQPLYAVFRDSSMSSDSVAVNFDQIFETYSPTTTRKVL